MTRPTRSGRKRGPVDFRIRPTYSRRATNQPPRPFSRKKGLRREAEIPLSIAMVPKGGLEPPRFSPPPPHGQARLAPRHFIAGYPRERISFEFFPVDRVSHSQNISNKYTRSRPIRWCPRNSFCILYTEINRWKGGARLFAISPHSRGRDVEPIPFCAR